MSDLKKIVFINQATGYLTIDILNAFASDFDEVALITGSIRIQDITPDPKVKISYIVKYNRGSNLKKAVSWMAGTLQILFLLMIRYRSHDKFFFTIPPTAYLFAPLFKSRFTIAIYDLYPDALKVHGSAERGVLFRWWLQRNRLIFPKAHVIYTLSEKMRTRILNQAPGAHVTVIPNWSAFSGLVPIEKKDNPLIQRENLQQKFVVQYSGNIGVTHNVEVLISIAEKLSHVKDLEFLIIGRGKRTEIIKKLIDSKNLENCRLIPFRKDEELFASLCAADLSVITLDEKAMDISVPSKLYNIMASGKPVMAIASRDSGTAEIIQSHQMGQAFGINDVQEMCDFIMALKFDPELRKTYSENSRKASREYTNANALKYKEYYLN